MENALLFTGLLLGAALTGGYFGSCCARSRQSENAAQELLVLRDRVEFLETKVQDADERLCLCERYDAESAQRIHDLEERVAEHELLIGETPNDGLLGRVGELEDARRKEGPKLLDLEACVDAQGDRLEVLEGAGPWIAGLWRSGWSALSGRCSPHGSGFRRSSWRTPTGFMSFCGNARTSRCRATAS